MDSTTKLRYCPYCMELANMEGAENCPLCHHSLEDVENGKEELPVYAVIDGRYMAGKSRESTEEFILYVGLDLTEKRRVWIREFFCRSLAYRKQGSSNIQTYAGQKEAYLKEYDACVREFQKAGNDKKVVFANGTVYQIAFLSEEEVSALCQNSASSDGQLSDSGKNEERKTLPESQEKKKTFQNLASSKKAKAAVMAVLVVCLLVSLLQKYKIIGGEERETSSASVSQQSEKTSSPIPSSAVPADHAEASHMPDNKPVASANSEVKESAVPKMTKEPADSKITKEPDASEPTKKPAAPKPTKKPAKSVKTPVPSRKSTKKKNTQKPKKQKPKKQKSVIDDSALDKKVYEID